jgi:WD40 repeat protein
MNLKLEFKGHFGPVNKLAFAKNSSPFFASCSQDKSIRLWNTEEYKQEKLFKGRYLFKFKKN